MAFRIEVAGKQWWMKGKASRWLEGEGHGWQKWMEGNCEWKANVVKSKCGGKEKVDGMQRWLEDEGERGPRWLQVDSGIAGRQRLIEGKDAWKATVAEEQRRLEDSQTREYMQTGYVHFLAYIQ